MSYYMVHRHIEELQNKTRMASHTFDQLAIAVNNLVMQYLILLYCLYMCYRRGFIMGIWNCHTSVGSILGTIIPAIWAHNHW